MILHGPCSNDISGTRFQYLSDWFTYIAQRLYPMSEKPNNGIEMKFKAD